jgi:hemoglobin
MTANLHLDGPAQTFQNPPTGGSSETLHHRLGGDDGIRAVVNRFLNRCQADPSLAPFFRSTDMRTHRRHVASFIIGATGGSVHRGRSIREAHAHLGIERRHFDAAASHLVAELESRRVPAEVIADVVGAIASLADDIVTVADLAG